MASTYLLLPNIGHESVNFIALLDQPGEDTRSIYDDPKTISAPFVVKLSKPKDDQMNRPTTLSTPTGLRQRRDPRVPDVDKNRKH